MTIDQKVGQLVLASLTYGETTSDLAAMVAGGKVTGVLLLGTGWSAVDVRQAVMELNAAAAPPIGLYVAADQEGGTVQRLSGAGFSAIPSAKVQGTWTTDKLTAQATVWGKEMLDAGVNLDLAPVADTVPASLGRRNAPIGGLNRQFANDPAAVVTHASAFIAGLTAAGVSSCVKHFPGLGRVTGNTDYTRTGIVDSATTRTDPYVTAFKQVMAAGPAMVMISTATYKKIDAAHPAAFSSIVINDLLRGQLGWTGVVISDSLDAVSVTKTTPQQRAVQFIAAGGDIAVFTSLASAQAAFAGLKAKAAASPEFAALVDAAVMRVLEAKVAAGLVADL